tara:strand:+ start:481 stop:1263 length:783 start_codon:yes stop_codon:yes gene_type:complete
MSKASIIIADKYLAGEIIVDKDKHNNIHVAESNISKIISGRRNTIVLDSCQSILSQIKSVLIGMCFTSRFIGTDMYDNCIYSDYDVEFKSQYLYGIQNIYNIPAGIVFYHTKNKLLFDCTNIEFMINESIISFKFTDLDIKKKYTVKRSNGDTQDAILIFNGGVSIKDDRLKIINTFNTNKEDELMSPYLGDLQKGIDLIDFLNINNLNITITLPFFDDDDIQSSNSTVKEVLLYYNDKLSDFKQRIDTYVINKYKIKIK